MSMFCFIKPFDYMFVYSLEKHCHEEYSEN